ncbi:hypothetical protein ETAA8_08410 [Anatilimnocola aggregata]|uniref:Carboxypeptidase regulatory-like domain-containing protein n=1 Tax=Anatilimnocola aggregata TaxID=2528021 RepID=A0A517Y6C1_9BACT|nr:hypothetical protein [Anatilimnocola aggregata]QDU25770.1 hypothetical protein ETAA8_08410 [Anatilimnocola aggregata]
MHRNLSLFGQFVGVVLLIAGLTSCNETGPRTVPVNGKITFGGGPWPKAGTLFFTPLAPAAGMPNQTGTAEFGLDGKFVVTSYEAGDGLVPGKYSVNIECWDTPVTEDSSAGKSYLPSNYGELIKSQLPIDIPLDARGPVQVILDVPKS